MKEKEHLKQDLTKAEKKATNKFKVAGFFQMSTFLKKLSTFFVLLFLLIQTVFPGGFVFAQTAEEIAAQEAKWREELAQTEADIAKWQNILDTTKKGTASLENDAKALQAKIAKAKLQIKAKTTAIENLKGQIQVKNKNINQLNQKLDMGKESLAQIIRKTDQLDSFSLIEVMLSSENLSDFFADIDDFESIQQSLHDHFGKIKEVKADTEVEKRELDAKQRQEIDNQKAIEATKKEVEKNEAEKKKLIQISKTNEKSYAQVLAERQKKAAEIRAALFALRDSKAIPFGDALAYANIASQKTGVRVAFILGILKQESNLGVNVGQCYVTNMTTGDGVGKNTGTPFSGVMKPSRDIPPFLALSKRVGFNPTSTAVSCPQAGGYGGAMGASQFIPSTWVLYEKRISSALGISTPNPWAPQDAIMATALFLMDLGASGGGFSAEQEAAARYYAGGAWKTRGIGYANSVLSHATNIQENMINPLKGL